MSSIVHDSILIYITLRRIAYLFMHVGHGSEPTTDGQFRGPRALGHKRDRNLGIERDGFYF
jgi:hypothetical protein